jgi:hypothetical protein
MLNRAGGIDVTEQKRIGCLHAHHGNIGYLDGLLGGYEAEASHFVDPALVRRIGVDPDFSASRAQQRVRSQLEWMAESGVDGIVITCTAYSAAMPPEADLGLPIPVVTIDEPFFAAVSQAAGPQTIMFTNPGTVAGTMGRLAAYAETVPVSLSAQSELIPEAFDLFMAGRQAEHDELLMARLAEWLRRDTNGTLFAGQLSMSAAAQQAGDATGKSLTTPLDTLEAAIVQRVGLRKAVG